MCLGKSSLNSPKEVHDASSIRVFEHVGGRVICNSFLEQSTWGRLALAEILSFHRRGAWRCVGASCRIVELSKSMLW